MKFLSFGLVLLLTLFNHGAFSQRSKAADGSLLKVKVTGGVIEGDEAGGIRSFKGIPYAQPPVGELRWRAPQPVKGWKGVLSTKKFGPKPMQSLSYSDMISRSEGMSEDCLYLNVWTPAGPAGDGLPVLVYFHGGGFVCGDGSEVRYDGESMAGKGIVMVTVNYRLGVFGFLAHPELSREASYHASGNYGLLDQLAALNWVHENIAAFGGDPSKVTIAGQSAGSISVSIQMASPLAKGLFRSAIGESGSVLGAFSPLSLADAEQNGVKFEGTAGAGSLAGLRKMPAKELLDLSTRPGGAYRTGPVIDRYFLPDSPQVIYSRGKQSDIPLLAGWTSAEIGYNGVLGKDAPTVENFKKAVQGLYGERAPDLLKVYSAPQDEDVPQVAAELAGDRFIAYSTWKWIDIHGKTNGFPVYRYLYAHPLPEAGTSAETKAKAFRGAPHSSDIAYALGNLRLIKNLPWTANDYKVSETMQGFFANFIKTGNPNGPGLPQWYGLQSSIPKVMVIDTESRSEPEKYQNRYLLLNQLNNNK